jgi:hypothetical protein
LFASTGIFGIHAEDTLEAVLVLWLAVLLPFKELTQELVHQFGAVSDVLQWVLAAPNKITACQNG